MPIKLIGKKSVQPVYPILVCDVSPSEVGEFFSAITKVEDVTLFEPQEFIEAGDSVTVLGYLEAFALDTKQKFQTEWVHVFTVRDGKITRWRGFTNSAARYGH